MYTNLSSDDQSVMVALDNTVCIEDAVIPALTNEPFDLDLPPEAMYGYLGDAARSTHGPLGWAYPAALATYAAWGINMHINRPQVHPTIFAMLLGGTEVGKSVTSNRVLDVIAPPRCNVRFQTPSSDRGLINLFAPPKPRKGEEPDESLVAGLVRLNEMRTMYTKMNMEGSSLASTLCDIWDGDDAGVVDKSGLSSMHARVSMLGNIPVVDPSELHEVMANESTKGLYSRMILCPGPTTWNWDFEWQAMPIPRPPVPVSIPQAAYRRLKEWVTAAPEGTKRRRISELALRTAVISSSANWEKVVTPACLDAALKFAEWQEDVRLVYTPSLAMDGRARVSVEIIGKMEAYVTPGTWFRWSAFLRDRNITKKYTAIDSAQLKNAFLAEGILDAELDESGKGRPVPTGMYRIITDKVLAEKAEERKAREMERATEQQEREEAMAGRHNFATRNGKATTAALTKFRETRKLQEAA